MVLQDYWDLFLLVEASALRTGLDSLLRPTLAAHLYVVVIALFLAWEYFFPWRPNQKKLRDGAGLDLFYTLFNYLLFWMLIGTAVVELTSVVFRDALAHYFGIEHWVAIRLEALPLWLRYVLLILALDLTSWLGPRNSCVCPCPSRTHRGRAFSVWVSPVPPGEPRLWEQCLEGRLAHQS